MELLSGWVKIHKIPHVIFETTSQFFFRLCITFQCHEVSSLKNRTLIWFFCPKLRMYEFKIYRVVICHDYEKITKLEEELTCRFKIDKRTLMNFDRSTQNSKKLLFNVLPLTKVYNVWVKKGQRSYVWWHWILMQNLKENWPVLSRMT